MIIHLPVTKKWISFEENIIKSSWGKTAFLAISKEFSFAIFYFRFAKWCEIESNCIKVSGRRRKNSRMLSSGRREWENRNRVMNCNRAPVAVRVSENAPAFLGTRAACPKARRARHASSFSWLETRRTKIIRRTESFGPLPC